MTHFSITRLHLRSLFRLPAFFRWNVPIVRALETAPGLIEARLYVDGGRTVWTVTLWENRAAMTAFRDSGAHQIAMPKLQELADESHVAQGEGAPPATLEATFRYLVDKGRASRLKHPSSRHAAKTFAFPRPWGRPQVIRRARQPADAESRAP
ncbi:MAG: antibiotic biosynthesis monooxygenase [Hyphomonadaceae bacterium]